MLAELDDYNWKEAFAFAGEPGGCHEPEIVDTAPGSTTSAAGFLRQDVIEILLLIEGERDVDDWVGIFRLIDGRFVHLASGCDYTGWDCRAWGGAFAADTLIDVACMGLSTENRRRALTDEPLILNPTLREILVTVAD